MNHPITRRRIVAAATLATLNLPALAQSDAPPLRFLVPTAPGSGADLIARAVQPALSRALGGRSVVVENISGAGGVTGTTQLVRAAPDGNTVAIVSVNHVINGHVYKKVPYDTVNDITPIVGLGSIPLVMLVNPQKTPVRDAKELADLVRTRPGDYNYSSPGNGSAPQLAARLFTDAAGVNVRHIPYRGTGPQVTALITGDVSFTIISASGAAGFLEAGKLKAVAVMSGQSLPLLPNVPTIGELGYPGATTEAWFGIVGPANMRPQDVAALNAAFSQSFTAPGVKKAMDTQMNVVNVTTADSWSRMIRSEFDRYGKLIRDIGLTLD